MPRRPRRLQRFRQPLQQQAAVGQAGQRVVVGQVAALGLLPAPRQLAGGQRAGTLADPLLQRPLRRAQLLLDALALAHLAGQLEVHLHAGLARLLLELQQRLVLEAAQQVALRATVDLPGADQQGRQQDQAEQAPALQLRVGTVEQIQAGRQQPGQGEGEEDAQAAGVGHAGGDDRRRQQAVDQRLLRRRGQRHEQHADHRQGHPRGGGAEQEGVPPAGGGLFRRAGAVEGERLPQAQRHQQAQPAEQHAEQQIARLAPQQADAAQPAEQHQQGRQAGAAIELAGQCRRDLLAVLLTHGFRLESRRLDVGREKKGHGRLRPLSEGGSGARRRGWVAPARRWRVCPVFAPAARML